VKCERKQPGRGQGAEERPQQKQRASQQEMLACYCLPASQIAACSLLRCAELAHTGLRDLLKPRHRHACMAHLGCWLKQNLM
jgi:hypothetical protein